MSNYLTHYWTGLSLSTLEKPASFDRTIWLLALRRAIARLAAEAAPTPAPAPAAKAGFKSQATRAIEAALHSGQPVDLPRMRARLDQRFSEYCAALEGESPSALFGMAEAQATARENGGNPFAADALRASARTRFSNAAAEASQRADQSRRQAESALAQYEQLQTQAAEQLSGYQLAVSSASSTPGLPSRLAQGSLAASCAFFLGSAFHTVLFGWGLAAVTATGFFAYCWYYGRSTKREAGDRNLVNLSYEMSRPASESLLAFYEHAERERLSEIEAGAAAAASALSEEATLQSPPAHGSLAAAIDAEIAAAGEEPLMDLNPGRVWLSGVPLAEAVLQQHWNRQAHDKVYNIVRGVFREHDSAPLLDRLLEATGELLGPAPFAAVLTAAFAQPVTASRLQSRLRALHLSAVHAAQLIPGLELDDKLSPSRVWIGLPEAEANPHALYFKRTFPNAVITHSTRPEAVEFVYQMLNISTVDLLSHSLSVEPYLAASPFERKALWHFPRRVKALSDKHEPMGNVVAIPQREAAG